MTTPGHEPGHLTASERLNLPRWDFGKKGFYEVYYLQWNDPAQKIAGWVRYTLLSPVTGSPAASLWAVFFDGDHPEGTLALKKDFSLDSVTREKDFFYLAFGSSAIFQDGMRGEIEQNAQKIGWNLKYGDDGGDHETILTHLPSPFYHLPFPKTKLTAPRFQTSISGDWSVGSRSWKLNSVPAHQSHFWGTESAESWTWASQDIMLTSSLGHQNSFWLIK